MVYFFYAWAMLASGMDGCRFLITTLNDLSNCFNKYDTDHRYFLKSN